MKIFLDDVRSSPPGWIRAYWPDDVIELLKSGNVEELSLDHDLGDDSRGTGYTVLLWIEEMVVLRNFSAPLIHVHTANISARKKMIMAVESIKSRSHTRLISNGL